MIRKLDDRFGLMNRVYPINDEKLMKQTFEQTNTHIHTQCVYKTSQLHLLYDIKQAVQAAKEKISKCLEHMRTAYIKQAMFA